MGGARLALADWLHPNVVHGGYDGETYLADNGCRGYRCSPAAGGLRQQFLRRELKQLVGLRRAERAQLVRLGER